MKKYMEQEAKSLYREQFEHDNCGIGAVVNSKGIKSHKTVENALKIVENLEHRAGKDAEGKTGDGVGRGLILEKSGSTESPSFSFHRRNCSAIRQRKCLRSL